MDVKRNLTLLTDLYELTMMNGYLKEGKQDEVVIFDVFFRQNELITYSLAAGLEQAVDYILNINFTESDIEYLDSLKIFNKEFLDYLSTLKFRGDVYSVPEGTVVTSTAKDGETKPLYTSDNAEVNVPMAVLTNKNTASAAELFAAVLRDFEKAKLVGSTTYGKGVMQDIYPLSDGSAIKITTAMFNPPVSENFNGVGLKPDFVVDLSIEQEKQWYELNSTNDPQLIKALSVVKSLTK